MKYLLIAIAFIICTSHVNATGYYWRVGSNYYPVGTIDDGHPDDIFSSTNLGTVWSRYQSDLQKSLH